MRSLLNLVRRAVFIATAFISVGNASSAYAVVIDFDDLVPVYDSVSPCFCDNPLTNQYESQGLLIDNAYLNGGSMDGGLTYENILLSGPYTVLYFVGQLPTFVSMNVTSSNGDAIYIRTYGPGGNAGEYQTAGFAGSDDDPLAIPNELVSFHSEAGISQVHIDAYYFLRVGAAIDNLTFTYSSVPEPSSLILMLLGCVAVFWRRISIK